MIAAAAISATAAVIIIGILVDALATIGLGGFTLTTSVGAGAEISTGFITGTAVIGIAGGVDALAIAVGEARRAGADAAGT